MLLMIFFLFLLILITLINFTALILLIHKLLCDILHIPHHYENRPSFIEVVIGYFWRIHGWLWHGYEVNGLDNIPQSGPALIIFYHGALPVDFYYFAPYLFFNKGRIIFAVVDNFLFKVPGFKAILDCMRSIPGSRQACSHILKQGNLLAIAPGGTYESQFSNQYNLMWRNRIGFAKIAIDAKVPIIPMFTENVREAYITMTFGRKLFLKLYELTKFPFNPIYGGYPVKMVTHIGKQIPYDPQLTPEQLQLKVANALKDLISANQRIPGSVLYSLADRIPLFKGRNKNKLE